MIIFILSIQAVPLVHVPSLGWADCGNSVSNSLPTPPLPAIPASVETVVETTHMPVGTSFLPISRDPLTNYRGQGPDPSEIPYLNPDLVASAKKPVANRFAQIRRDLTGKKDDPIQWLKDNLRDPNKQPLLTLISDNLFPWEGFCDQWSAGPGSDVILNSLLRNSSDLTCDGTYLSTGEIAELMTAFYSDYYTADSAGVSYGAHHLDKTTEDVFNQTGIYSFEAKDHENLLNEYLGKDQTIIEDLHAPGQVWNYPIYRKTTQYRDLSVDDIAAAAVPLPPELFISPSGGRSAQILADYKLATEGLETYSQQDKNPVLFHSEQDKIKAQADFEVISKKREELRKQAFALGNQLHLVADSSTYGDEPLVELQKRLYQEIGSDLKRGDIQIDPNREARLATTRVDFARESQFAQGMKNTPRDSQTTEYYLTRKKSETQYSDSRWVSPVSARPTSAWVAGTMAKPGSNPYASSYGLGDLVDLLHRCTNMNDVMQFFTQLEAIAKQPDPSQPSWEKLRETYQKLKPVLNDDKIREDLQSSRSPMASYNALVSP